MATKHVRVRAFNLKKGYLVRTIVFMGKKYTSERVAGKGWYVVSDSLAEQLGELRQDGTSDPEVPTIFEVMTKEEAEAVEAKERDLAFDSTVTGQTQPGNIPQVGRATKVADDGSDASKASQPSGRRARPGRSEAATE